MTRIIAEIKNKSDVELIYRFLTRFKTGKVRMMNEEEWEDFVLGKMAEESEKDMETVPRKEISKWFKKHGINF